MKVIALDFDGVICDSMSECMVVTYMAYTGQHNIPAGFGDYFRKHRHIVRPAREYWLIAEAYHRDIEPSELDGNCEAQLAEFESRFYAARKRLRAADFRAWLSLHHLYSEFAEAWPLLRNSTIPYVVTTRDRDSLSHLLDTFGVDIPSERWWTKERTLSKPDAVRRIAAERGISTSEILFVDDHPGHLYDVSQTGASVIWAKWGFWPSQNSFETIDNMKQLIQRLSDD